MEKYLKDEKNKKTILRKVIKSLVKAEKVFRKPPDKKKYNEEGLCYFFEMEYDSPPIHTISICSLEYLTFWLINGYFNSIKFDNEKEFMKFKHGYNLLLKM